MIKHENAPFFAENNRKTVPDRVVTPVVPEEVYTDRAEFLEYFYEHALKAGTRRSWSVALLGQRRMGKTEIFKRVVNRLFFEQDPHDPKAVVPVYYSFPDNIVDHTDFALRYLENFMRYYVGFYTRQTELVLRVQSGDELFSKIESIRPKFPYQESLDCSLAGTGRSKRVMLSGHQSLRSYGLELCQMLITQP